MKRRKEWQKWGSSMIKIALVLAYEGLVNDAFKTFEMHNKFYKDNHNDQETYFLEEYIGLEHDSELNLDCDVIISRGLTAEYLKGLELDIPIVEIPIVGSDLLRCLYQSQEKYGNKKVAVVGTYNMIYGAREMGEIIGVETEPLLLKNYKDCYIKAKEAFELGCKVLIGGMTTSQNARKLGMKTILLSSWKDSLWQALLEAKRLAPIGRKERQKSQMYKTIFDYTYDGVIALDKKNKVIICNSSAKKVLKLHEEDLTNLSVEKVLDGSGLRQLIVSEPTYYDEIVHYKDIELVANKVPIELQGMELGKVINFQDVTGIQKKEKDIRKKLFSKGHISKYTFNDIIGNSPVVLKTMEKAKKFSEVDFNILLVGATGTGKEMFAQGIHSHSQRKSGPFVAVNCAALPEALLESELFGYVEGAFTGANKGGKMGYFELAHKGTIFLDEISGVSLKLQSRLLRVLQEKEIVRVGDDKIIAVDVRVIAATNEDLLDMVNQSQFRRDLYYRLNVLNLRLPNLKERGTDIILIANQMIHYFTQQLGRKPIKLTDGAKKKLLEYDWPGNIRELHNICSRLVVLSSSGQINKEDVLEAICHCIPDGEESDQTKNKEKEIGYKTQVKLAEKDVIEDALKQAKYNRSKAAAILGMSTSTLWRKMKENNLL